MVPRAATGYVSAMTLPRLLIVIGVVLVLIGLAWPFLSKLGLGKLPGDIVIRREVKSQKKEDAKPYTKA